ncbi:hypothetical protein [Streptomyces sp. NPDC088725]|uniref:hypothetical protein n=1 Tax=Streptomyces sp. NPDC088725 TaxID=3365873 RepID=UPI003823D20B
MKEIDEVSVARELPDAQGLSSRQLRGVECVFCGRDLALGDVRDLGQQHYVVYGSRVSWFPRADPACVTGGAS